MVQDVEDLPAELQQVLFGIGHLPGLAQSRIQTSVTGSANLATSSGFAGEVMAKCADPGWAIWIWKHVGYLSWERTALLGDSGLRGSNLRGRAAQLPVCRPCAAVANGQWESAGPAGKA